MTVCCECTYTWISKKVAACLNAERREEGDMPSATLLLAQAEDARKGFCIDSIAVGVKRRVTYAEITFAPLFVLPVGKYLVKLLAMSPLCGYNHDVGFFV